MKKLLCSVLAAAALLCGCSNSAETSESPVSTASIESKDISLFAMDTYMTLKAYGKNADSALKKSSDEILRLESLFDVTSDESDISKINSSGGNAVSVSDDTADIISRACQISGQTNGSLDITIYPVLKEWGFTTENYKIPQQKEIDVLLEYVDYKKVNVDGNTVTLPENMNIDLGSVAKGYTSDRICQILEDEGINSAMVNLGGNVQVIGKKTDGSLWRVGVENPQNTEEMACKLSVSNCAVITSGNYERFFVGEDGKKYWHIIDPKTGYPADNGIISATVIGNSGLICDALSTALFVMGTERAVEYCTEHKEIDAVLITSDMKLYITDGIADNAEILLSDYSVIKR